MSLIVDTQKIESVATPAHAKPADIEATAYRNAFKGLSNSFFNPEAEVEGPVNPSLEQKAQLFEGVADENMVPIPQYVAKINKVAHAKL
jgi:hypothetical protein